MPWGIPPPEGNSEGIAATANERPTTERAGSGFAEQGGHRDFKALQQTRPGTLTWMPAADEMVSTGFEMEDLNRPGFRVYEPVFADTVFLVEIALVNRSRRRESGK